MKEKIEFCAYSKDRSTRDRSTSGGFCAEAARSIIDRGGVVYGSAFDSDFRSVRTIKVSTMHEYFSLLSKSKYSFSLLPPLDEVRRTIQSGIDVLFIGSPCQISAVRRFVGDIPDSCVLCDLRCRGYSKTKKLSDLIDKVSVGRKVTSVDFRPNHKTKRILLKFDDNTELTIKKHDFVKDVMDMCKSCMFGHGFGDLSESDLTVGDFWKNMRDRMNIGKRFTPEMGCNIVSINTDKGHRFFDSIKGNLEFLPLFKKKPTPSTVIDAIRNRVFST